MKIIDTWDLSKISEYLLHDVNPVTCQMDLMVKYCKIKYTEKIHKKVNVYHIKGHLNS